VLYARYTPINGIIIALEDTMQNVLARVRNPALRQGLIFGIILGVILLALSFISTNFFITLALILLAAFLAGRRASQETGRITTGTLAGLWTGLIGIFIPSIISVILVLINIDAYRNSIQTAADKQHQHITYTNSMVITSLLINVLFLIVLGVLPGVIGGALGGNISRRRAHLPPIEEYHEAELEPTSETQTEEPPSSESQIEEPTSETSSDKPSSLTQQAE
jgi:ABC-type transport system involved in cytochrome bd biosynthesis fused ATPase/permease subunit